MAPQTAGNSTVSSSVIPSLFGDALALATAAKSPNTVTPSTTLIDSHAGKKTVEKQADINTALSAKVSAKVSSSTPINTAPPSPSFVSDVPAIPPQPIASGDVTSAQKAPTRDEAPVPSDGSFGQILTLSVGSSSVSRAVRATNHAPTQQATAIPVTTSIKAASAGSAGPHQVATLPLQSADQQNSSVVAASSSTAQALSPSATAVFNLATDASSITTQTMSIPTELPSNTGGRGVDLSTVKQPVAQQTVSLADTVAPTTGTDSMPVADSMPRIGGDAPVMSKLPTESDSQVEDVANSVDQKPDAADAKTQASSPAKPNHNDAGDERTVSAHHATAKQPEVVNAHGADQQDAPATNAPQGSSAGSGRANSQNDTQDPSAASAEGRTADAAAALGAASATLPQVPIFSDALGAGVTSGDSTTDGFDLNLNGLSVVTSAPSKSSVVGGSSLGSKSKSGDSDSAVPTPSGNSSLQKLEEPAQVTASANGNAANANVVAGQPNVHAGTATNGVSQVDGKATQQGAGDKGTDVAASSPGAGSAQSLDGSATQVVHRAQLIQAMHGSEMRMGMNSAEFGNISISAAVSHQTLTAQISLNHAGLSQALTAQLPDIEKKLGSAYGLPSRVEVRDGSSSPQQGSSRREGDRAFGNASGIPVASQAGLGSTSVMAEPASSTTYAPSAGMRLDILI